MSELLRLTMLGFIWYITPLKSTEVEANKGLMINRKVLVVLVLLLIPPFSASAYWVWSPEEGKFVNAEGDAQNVADEQYQYAIQALQDEDYDEAVKQLESLIKKHPSVQINNNTIQNYGEINISKLKQLPSEKLHEIAATFEIPDEVKDF